MDLDLMKYADLQRLAKDIGLKANMKADKLLKALKQHYKEECCLNTLYQLRAELLSVKQEQLSPNAPLVDNTAFVTKRRGRGKNAKRNNPEEDGGADGDLNLSQRSVQTDHLEEAAEGKGSNKRKRISGVYKSGTAEHSVVQEGTLEHQAQPSVVDGIEKARTVQGENQRSMKPAGKIPRHEGLLKRGGRPVLNPTTPNFKKLHEAHFNKMESIDSYVQRKNRQVEVFRNSVKELKLLSEKTIPKTADKNSLKPSVSRASMFSPQSQKTRPVSDKRRLTQLSTSKPSQKDSSVFRPSILSAKKINVRFSQATKDNERKRSMVKTPARVSPHVPLVSTPGTQSTEERKPALPVSNIKTPGVFVFNGNTSISTTPATNKKNAFDLKASLSRPLTYQPYKGKLKPFGVTQENAVQSQTTQSHQKNYKRHKIQTREERRTKHTDNRKQKKEKILGARRGLVLA